MIWFQCIHQEQRKRQILPPTKKTKKRPKPEESDVSDSINKKKRPADTKSDIDSKSHSTAEDNSNVEDNGNINSAPDNATVEGNKYLCLMKMPRMKKTKYCFK